MSRRTENFNRLVTAAGEDPQPNSGWSTESPATAMATTLLKRNGDMPKWLRRRIKGVPDPELKQRLVNAIAEAQQVFGEHRLANQVDLAPRSSVHRGRRRT